MNIAFSQNEVRKVRLMESGDLRIFRAVAEEGRLRGRPNACSMFLQRHGPDPPAGGQAQTALFIRSNRGMDTEPASACLDTRVKF